MSDRESLFHPVRPVCSVAVCDRPAAAHGLCGGHAQRLRKHGSPGDTTIAPRTRNVGKVCSVESCDHPAKSRGFCLSHYWRWRYYGDPLGCRKPPEHGTVNMYGNHGCRCDACREANTEYHRSRGTAGYAKDLCSCGRPKRAVATHCRACTDAERAAEHGSEAKYRGGCRCSDCRAAATAGKRRRREQSRVPCSHGCGTMVDRNPGKPPECRACAMRRVNGARRKVAA